jgi:ABC-type multidrug transport system ATPase subunit
MNKFSLKAENISKSFIRKRNIFSNISIDLSNGEIKGIAGENGSGKSTFLKILLGVLPPTKGSINFEVNNEFLKREDFSTHIGFVSPYLMLYEEFTPEEHLRLFAKFRSEKFDSQWFEAILKEFKLLKRRNDQIKTFSSGMKQRVKYMLALQTKPEILFLDEPFTNLDAAGIESVHQIIKNQIANGGSVVIASNDDREKSICSEIITLTA